MKYTNIKGFIALLSFTMAVVSCKKVATPDPIGDGGKTIIKVNNGGDNPNFGHVLLGIDFLTTPQSVDVFQVYRDAASNASLNTALTVVVKDDTAALRTYNTLHGTNILHLPRSWYTANFPASSMGGNYTIPFAAGDYSQVIRITIPNSTVLDPSSTYGLVFTLVSNSANEAMSAGKTYVFEVGAKNIYDGVYSVVSGYVQRYSAPGTPTTDALNGDLSGNPDIEMSTTGATTVYADAFAWHDATTNGYVGGVDPIFITVDPSTNLTTAVSNTNATLTNWAGKVNKYDPATKTFYIAMRWNPVSTVREYETVLKYKKAR
ncbi:DUF1735 domain-containing protein [Ferruginibacter sp.]